MIYKNLVLWCVIACYGKVWYIIVCMCIYVYIMVKM